MSTDPPALSFENVSKQFGRIHAVRNLSLQVEPGQLAGFLGPNGAGKSTTLYMIPRLVRPSAGRIRIFGVDLWEDYKQAIASVGVLVERPAFYEYLSGRKNLELAARVRGAVPPRQIDEILERIGLADRQHDRVGTYSMGMKQRLGVGWTLLGRPRLLVLDEPTNGMDPDGTREILQFLRDKVRSDGLTVFLSSHLLHEIEEYCESVFVIDHGSLVASGKVRDILKVQEPILRVTFQGSVPAPKFFAGLGAVRQTVVVAPDALEITLAGEDAAWLNQRLHEAGFKVAALVPKQRTLKEFFLSTTGEPRHVP